jgi:hypothetical protein
MKRNQIERQALPADWTEVIDQVQDILTQTERTAGERALRLTTKEPNPPKEKTARFEPTLEDFEERIQRFRAALQKAEDDGEEADIALADGERALQAWLARAKESANKITS